MSKAIYYQQGPGVELDVVATRGDKVDLGRGEEVLVRNVQVVSERVIGCATLVAVAKPESKPEKSLSSMNKEELLTLAAERSVEVNAEMTKAHIIEALEAAAKP